MFNADKPIFITFRLKFTLPKAAITELEHRKRLWLDGYDSMGEADQAEHKKQKDGLFFAWFDQLLDNSPDVPKILHRKDISEIIANALKYHDGKRYQLLAYCIMPNHVHALIFPLKDENGSIYAPAGITYSWKRFTSNQINKLLGKSGSLWQRESFDRMVRDEEELGRTLEYILQNPVKAGWVGEWKQWRGSYLREELLS